LSEREQEIKYENRVLLKKMLNIDLRTAQAANSKNSAKQNTIPAAMSKQKLLKASNKSLNRGRRI